MQTTGELLTSATGPMVYWGQDENILGVVHLEDELRESTREAVVDLQASGLQVIMLTGDHEAAARRIALELELDEFHHDMTPQGKFAFVQALQEKGKVLVCESGIHGREEIEEFEALGVHAFLIGESLMTAEDIPAKLKELLGHGGE